MVPEVREVLVELPVTREAPGTARRAVASLPWGEQTEAAFKLRLLASELVTNSLRHAGLSMRDRIRLEMRLHRNCVRVEVSAPGRDFALPDVAKPPTGVAGRGLFLVNTLADRWGTQSHERRAMVWFEIDLR